MSVLVALKSTTCLSDDFTAQQMDFGRYLFFDPILSDDNSISCATVIIQTKAQRFDYLLRFEMSQECMVKN